MQLMAKAKVLGILVSFFSIMGAHAAQTTRTEPPTVDELSTSLTPISIRVPALKSGFEFSVAALWLQPSGGDLLYSVLTSPFPIESPSWENQYVSPGHTFSFDLGMRYVFSDTGRDVQLQWTHMDSNDSDATNANVDDGQFVAPPYETGPDGGGIENSSSSVNFNYDVINLDVGQYLQFGQRVQMRFFNGVSYAKIKQAWNSFYTDNPGDFTVSQDVDSDYQSFGPRAGVLATYDIGHHIHLVSQVASSLLIGELKSSTTYLSSSDTENIENNYQTIDTDDQMEVVPAFDGKLGLSYTYPVDESVLTIEAGYQAAVYLNAIYEAYPTSVVEPIQNGTIAVDTMGTSQSNFSVNGPYFRLAWRL
jgi:hypothetical protein